MAISKLFRVGKGCTRMSPYVSRGQWVCGRGRGRRSAREGALWGDRRALGPVMGGEDAVNAAVRTTPVPPRRAPHDRRLGLSKPGRGNGLSRVHENPLSLAETLVANPQEKATRLSFSWQSCGRKRPPWACSLRRSAEGAREPPGRRRSHLPTRCARPGRRCPLGDWKDLLS